MGKHRRSRTTLRKEQGITRHGRQTGRWKRRSLLVTVALGGVGVIVASSGFTGSQTAVATEMTVEPTYGAGLFDVDPDQGSVSQDPNVAVTGDIAVFPEDWEF